MSKQALLPLEYGRVDIYAQGLVSCSACAPAGMPAEEVAQEVNRQAPNLPQLSWHISDDLRFADGQLNPSPCEHAPKTRQHWLLVC